MKNTPSKIVIGTFLVFLLSFSLQAYERSYIVSDTIEAPLQVFEIYSQTNIRNKGYYNTSNTVSQTSKASQITFTEQTSISLCGVYNSGSVDWGDFNNDRYLDILLTGVDAIGNRIAKIYKNNGNSTFTEQTGISLVGISGGHAVWGDYNNDGYLDILLSGSSDYDEVSIIYKNNRDGTFTKQTGIFLQGVQFGSVAWGDYNNDGYLDFLLTGQDYDKIIAKIFSNKGDGTFAEQTGISIAGVLYSSADWGDYDNDGDLDILINGNFNGPWFTKIYQNNGNNNFVEQTGTLLKGIAGGSADWGDYNNDGYLDILLTGWSNDYNSHAKVYKNNGNGTFTEQTAISLSGVYSSSAGWGDYNNDGFLDIAIMGSSNSGDITKLYKYDGNGGFIEDPGVSLTGVSSGDLAWGDYDNDNDLDILITGESGDGMVAKIYKNDGVIANTPSQTPNNLKASVIGRTVTLSWDVPIDTETLQPGLSYNIYLGTSPANYDICSPNADTVTGLRRIVRKGSIQTNSYTFKNLDGGTYYWSVQAIDNCFSGSTFAPQSGFSVTHYNSITPVANQSLITGESGIPLNVSESFIPDSRQWKYSFNLGGPYDILIEGENNINYTPNFSDAGPHYIVCVSKFGEIEVISNEIQIMVHQFTEITTNAFDMVSNGSMAWGDYNNDGFLDILLTGNLSLYEYNSPELVSKIYSNNGNSTFTQLQGTPFTGVYESSVAWGDYDNDGLLDVLITGTTNNYHTGVLSKIYHNNGDSTFTELKSAVLTGVHLGSAAWIDYDNDGDLDVFISGYNQNGNQTFKIYKNDKSSFSETGSNIIPFADGAFDLGDYNSDGYIDIIMIGYDNSGNRVTRIYTGESDGTFSILPADNIVGMSNAEVVWADYDNDGFLDFIISGTKDGWSETTLIYRNNGNSTFSEQNTIALPGVLFSSIAWADYNNDGNLDFIVTGSQNEFSNGAISKIYRNKNDGTFSEQTGITLPQLYKSDNNWADYDNDGDLDLFLLGRNVADECYTVLLRNNCIKSNNIPLPTEFLSSKVIAGNAFLTWKKASDTETIQNGLTYNIVIALQSDTAIIKNPLSDLHTGYRKIIDRGNIGHDTTYVIKGLTEGKYIWAVQTIDNSFTGSVFSEWNSFEILPQYSEKQTIIGLNDMYIDWVDYNNDSYLDVYITGKDWVVNGVSSVYKNGGPDSCVFTKQTDILLPGVFTRNSGGDLREDYEYLNNNAGVAWGDYNNDGFLDLLVAGDTNNNDYTSYLTKIYSNNRNGTFSELTKNTLPTFSYGASVNWIDYNNDGFQDVFLTGMEVADWGGSGSTKLLRNNGDSTFTAQTDMWFVQAINGSTDIGDYDNDGFMDIVITGSGFATLYHNTGKNGFEKQTEVALTGIINSTTSFVDIDNDGYLDIFITGMNNEYNRMSKIYHNNGNRTFTDANIILRGMIGGSANWGDYDNDGDLDLLMTGKSGSLVNYVYRNNGNNTLTELNYGLCQIKKGYSSFGDFDNDGDLDIVAGGQVVLSNNSYTNKTIIYENNGNYENAAPTIPLNLRTKRIAENYSFIWNTASDDYTPNQTLTYNLRIGTTPGGRNILSPLSLNETNKLLIPKMGNCQISRSKIIKGLKPDTYYWSVQAVDQTFKAGQWAEEQTLIVSAVSADFVADTVCFGWPTQFTNMSIELNEPITNWFWNFANEGISSEPSPSFTFSKSGIFPVTLIVQTASFTDSTTINVVVKSTPNVNFSAPPVCFGTETKITNTTLVPIGNTATLWQWNFGAGSSNAIQFIENPGTYTYTKADTFNVSLVVKINNGCSDSIYQQVIVTPQPDANIFITSGSKFSFCKNSGDSAGLVISPQTNCSIQWLNNNYPIVGEYQNQLLVKETGGLFKALVTNTLGGCSVTSATAVEITIQDAPPVPIIREENNLTQFCSGTLIKLLVDNASPNYQYQWQRSGVDIFGAEGSALQGALQGGDYSVVLNSGACVVESQQITLTQKLAPPKPEIVAQGPNVWVLGCTNDSAQAYRWYYNNQLLPNAILSHYIANKNLGNYEIEINDGTECWTKSDVIIIPTGSLKGEAEVFNESEVEVFPNPSNNNFSVNFGGLLEGDINVTVTNLVGKIVITQQITNTDQIEIDLSGNGAGIYICKIEYKGKMVMKKLLKQVE